MYAILQQKPSCHGEVTGRLSAVRKGGDMVKIAIDAGHYKGTPGRRTERDTGRDMSE